MAQVLCLSPMKLHLNFFCTLRFNLAQNFTNISTHNRIPNIQRKVVQFWGEKENIACNFRLGPLLQNTQYVQSFSEFASKFTFHSRFQTNYFYQRIWLRQIDVLIASDSVVYASFKYKQKGIKRLYTHILSLASSI